VEQNSLCIRHENAKVKAEKDQLYIALQMTHQNCDELLKIAEKKTVIDSEQLGETLKQHLQVSQKKNEHNGIILSQITSILNRVADKQLAALEIALIIDKKFDTFDETCSK
jgi:hypothetical protein